MVLLIDNYDSFVYNLADYIGHMGWEPAVFRNDALSLEDIEALAPSHIVLSPGPCTPLEAGISNDVIRHFAGRIPLLGVCLGHQCIGHVFGGRIVRAGLPMHGKASLVYHDGRGVLAGLPSPLAGGRYHSLVIEPASLPACLEVSARTEDGEVMAVRHRQFAVEGVQFHPESILTPPEAGHRLLRNFLEMREQEALAHVILSPPKAGEESVPRTAALSQGTDSSVASLPQNDIKRTPFSPINTSRR